MRVVVRSEIRPEELANAITEGIRGAHREEGRVSHLRRVQDLKAADEAAGGTICKNVDKLISDEALLVQKLFTSAMPADIKAARTEIERLVDYIGLKRQCQGP